MDVIKGKIVYKKIEGGFWAIIANNGARFKPVDFPVDLQTEGLNIECTISYIQPNFTNFMWGDLVKITKFVISRK